MKKAILTFVMTISTSSVFRGTWSSDPRSVMIITPGWFGLVWPYNNLEGAAPASVERITLLGSSSLTAALLHRSSWQVFLILHLDDNYIIHLLAMVIERWLENDDDRWFWPIEVDDGDHIEEIDPMMMLLQVYGNDDDYGDNDDNDDDDDDFRPTSELRSGFRDFGRCVAATRNVWEKLSLWWWGGGGCTFGWWWGPCQSWWRWFFFNFIRKFISKTMWAGSNLFQWYRCLPGVDGKKPENKIYYKWWWKEVQKMTRSSLIKM